MRVFRWCLVLGAAMLVPSAAAQAATYNLDAGADGLAGAPANTAPLKFYAPSITVRQGSKVTWTIKGFHTVTFLKRGQGVPPFSGPDPHTITDLNDAAGKPFWFNGQSYGGTTRQAATVTKVKSYTGNQYVNTGFPSPGAKLTLTFPKKGTFTYYCLVHPGMAGVVKVVGKHAKVKTPAQVAARVRRLEAADANAAHQADSVTPPANTVDVGYQVGAVSVNQMFPATLTVKAGTQVTFTGKQQTIDESHSVAFGPEGPAAQQTGGGMPLPGGPPGYFVLSPYVGPYPSEADTSNIGYDGSNHGDGFLGLGLLSRSLPPVKVRFTKPGIYTFVCGLHPGMNGTIQVT